jgi:hypothetical protein
MVGVPNPYFNRRGEVGKMSGPRFCGYLLNMKTLRLNLLTIIVFLCFQRYKTHCKTWLIGQILLLILQVCLFAFFATVIPSKIATWYSSIVFLASSLYKIYCLYVVKSFMVEIRRKEMRKASSSSPPLIPVATSNDEEQASPLDDN